MSVDTNGIPKEGLTIVNEYTVEQAQNGDLKHVKRTKTYGSISNPELAKTVQELAKIHMSL